MSKRTFTIVFVALYTTAAFLAVMPGSPLEWSLCAVGITASVVFARALYEFAKDPPFVLPPMV